MYVCVLDRQGKKLVHTNVKDNDFKFFLKLVEPYKHDLTVYCLCFWTAPRRLIAALEVRSRFRVKRQNFERSD